MRSSHDLRSDIGLGVYGALMLWGLLGCFDTTPRRRIWPLLTGLALYVGLESIPTVAFILAASAGLLLLIHFRLRRWQEVALYALGAALACGLYLGVHFLPDVQTNLTNYSEFARIYADVTASGQLENPLPVLLDYHLRFSMSLSPVEAVLLLIAGVSLIRSRYAADRWLLASFSLAAVVLVVFAPPSYGYWAMFAPFWAYAIARTANSKIVLYALIPALAAAPLFDMARAAIDRPNSQRLAAADSISDRFEKGATILGEPLFWFTLEADHEYFGWTAMSRYRRRYGTSFDETIQALDPDSIICAVDFEDVCERIDALGWFTPPEAVTVDDHDYLIFQRLRD